MRSRLGPATLLRRQLVADRGVGAVVLVVVLVVSGLVAAWPRVIEHVFTEDLHESLDGEPARTRDLVTVSGLDAPLLGQDEFGRPGSVSTGDVYGAFDAALDDLHSAAPEPARSTLGSPEYVLAGPEMRFGDHAPYWPDDIRNGEITLTADPGYLDRIELTGGTAPGIEFDDVDPEEVFGPPIDPDEIGVSDDVPAPENARWFSDPLSGARAFAPGETVRLVTIGIAMTDQTAEDFAWEIGEVRELGRGLSAQLTATFEPHDSSDDYWQHHGSILAGHEFVDLNVGTTMIGEAYVDPAALGQLTGWDPSLLAPRLPLSLRLWLPVDVGDERVGAAPEILDSLRAFLADPATVEHGPGTESAQEMLADSTAETSLTMRFATQATDVLEQTLSAQAAAAALIAMVVAGPLGATIAVLALALKLLVERRRAAMSLVGARGASMRQMRVLLAVEGLLLGVPAAVAGAYLAERFVPGDGGPAGWVMPALIGVTPVVLLPLLIRPTALRGQRRDLGRFRRGWLRWTADVLVLGAAGTALWLLNRRGLEAGAATSGVDPLLAATPLLLALAACVVVLRLYPIPVVLLARAWRSRPGLVSYVGASRAVRDPAGGLAAVLALVVGLTVGVVSTVLWSTTEQGVADAAEASVGADLRADGPVFSAEQRETVAAMPDVETSTSVSELGRIAMTGEDGRTDTVDVYVADLAALSQIQDGFADTVHVPDVALEADGSSVPVIASSRVGSEGYGGRVSYTRPFDIHIVATGTDVPGVTRGDRWILMDRSVVDDVAGTNAGSHPRTVLVASSGDVDEVRGSVAGVLPPRTQLKTLADAANDVTAGALGAGLRGAFTVAAVLGGALAAAAVIITMVIAAPSRGRLFSQLRTLGLSSRQARGLATWELAPLAVTAVASGCLLGLAIPWLLLPSVDLAALTGGSSQPGMSVDWTLVGGAVGGFVVVAVLAMSVAVASSRRLRLGTVLRVGDEGG